MYLYLVIVNSVHPESESLFASCSYGHIPVLCPGSGSSLSWVWVCRPKRILNPGLGRRRSGRQSWHPTSNRRTGRDRRPSFPTNALPWIPSWMVEYAQSPTSSCRGHRWWQWVQSRKGSGRWLGRHRHKGCWPRSSALRRIRRCPKIAASSPTMFLVKKKR